MKYEAHATVNNSTEIVHRGNNKLELRKQIIQEIKANIFAGKTNLAGWSITDEDGYEVFNGYIRGK